MSKISKSTLACILIAFVVHTDSWAVSFALNCGSIDGRHGLVIEQ